MDEIDLTYARSLDDEDLGRYLWDYTIRAYASDMGVTNPGKEFARKVTAIVLNFDTDCVKNVGLEKALKRAANQDMEGAGKMFREYFYDGALRINQISLAKAGVNHRKVQSKKGRLPRKAPLDNGETIDEVVGRVTKNNLNENTNDLWKIFCGELDNLKVLESSGDGFVEYCDERGKSRSLKKGTFRNKVSELRNKAK
jgi:hypothetical protein